MASTHVYSEIKAKLEAGLSYSVIDYDTIDAAMQQREEPFLVLEELESSEQQTSMGDPMAVCMMETGSIIVHGFVPAPESSGRARQLSDEVRDLMRHVRMANIRITEASPADMEALNEGLWSSASTYLRYDYDFFIERP